MDIKQRFPLLSHDVKEAMRSGRSLADISQMLRHHRQEYLNIPSTLFLRYVHTVYMELALESSTRVNNTRQMGPGCKMPPRPRATNESSAHLNALLTRFVRERVASARERPSAAFITPERVILDRVVLDEPETITMYADPRVMGSSLSNIRMYSSCHSLQVSSRPEEPLLRISVKFLPSAEGPFKGSIVLLVGNRRTIVPIEAYVTAKQTGARVRPSPLLPPIRVPGLPIDSNKLPRKVTMNNINRSTTVTDNHPVYSMPLQLSPDMYDGRLAFGPIPYQSPTTMQVIDTNTQIPLSSGFSLSVGAITVSDSDCEPAVSYQTYKEPPKPCVSPTNVLMVKKRSSVSQRAPTRLFTNGKELDGSTNFRNMLLSDKPRIRRYSLPHQGKSSPKPHNIENQYNTASQIFSAPNSCLSSLCHSESDEFVTGSVLKDIPQLIESIVDLTVSTQDPTTIIPSPNRNLEANEDDTISATALQLPHVLPRCISEMTDGDYSTTWGSLTDGDSSCEDTMLSSQAPYYNFTVDEIKQMNKIVVDWNTFSQFDPNEQVDITDGGDAVTVASVSGWHTSRLNLLTDITYEVIMK